LSHKQKTILIDRAHPHISISRQAELLDVSRSSIYYAPHLNPEEIRITRAIDEIYTNRPFYGSRRMADALRDQYAIRIGRHRTRRLMRLMGLEAIYPKKRPKTSESEPSHKKYPYLLRNIAITRPNQVWGTDITYLRLEDGWAYLVAIMDWYSRYVVAWRVSLTLESDFCIAALNTALNENMPEIFNSDQGTQFTDNDFTKILAAQNIRISMDGRGRFMDNIFTERLWRTVKYENVFLKSYRNIAEAENGLAEYFLFYNTERRHQSLNRQTPAEVYFNHQRSNQKFTISTPPILSNLSTITV
jgi:putative transposase